MLPQAMSLGYCTLFMNSVSVTSVV